MLYDNVYNMTYYCSFDHCISMYKHYTWCNSTKQALVVLKTRWRKHCLWLGFCLRSMTQLWRVLYTNIYINVISSSSLHFKLFSWPWKGGFSTVGPLILKCRKKSQSPGKWKWVASWRKFFRISKYLKSQLFKIILLSELLEHTVRSNVSWITIQLEYKNSGKVLLKFLKIACRAGSLFQLLVN